jgi:hypothetical protein
MKKIKIISLCHRGKSIDQAKVLDLSLAGALPTVEELKNMGKPTSLLLDKVAQLCVIKLTGLQIRDKARKSRTVKLEYPFCVEVTADVIRKIINMLDIVKKKYTDENEDKVRLKRDMISFLTILDIQFYCLKQSGIDLKEIGFDASGNVSELFHFEEQN